MFFYLSIILCALNVLTPKGVAQGGEENSLDPAPILSIDEVRQGMEIQTWLESSEIVLKKNMVVPIHRIVKLEI